MNVLNPRRLLSPRYLAAFSAMLLISSIQADPPKKPAAPAKAAAPAKPAAAARPASGGSAKPGGATTASHGPTANGPSANTSKGPTANGTHGPTTQTPHSTTAGTGTHQTIANKGAVSPGGGSSSKVSQPTKPAPPGGKTVQTANASVSMRSNGKPADIHVNKTGMDIHHNLNGSRRVEVERADHSRVVAYRGGRGYVQHPYRYGDREFGHRTYYYNGRYYDNFYARNYYRGYYMDVYSPAYYYGPGFYGWAYNPWVSPVSYAWGWGGNPWYGYYGYYFNPYPVYPSASYWLTDYLVSATLTAAYASQANAAAQAQATNSAPPPDAAPLSPEVKNLISAEVARQISLENAESTTAAQASADPASSGIQRMLTDNVQHVFVAGAPIDVTTSNNTECAISEGDALQLTGPPPAEATTATLSVLSSKGRLECPKGSVITVNISDLQDMQNHMRETIDQGMGELQTKQGKGGLPTLPPSAAVAPVKAAFAAGAPGPDQTAATEIAQQSQQADQAEKEALSQVPASPGTSLAVAPAATEAPAGPPSVLGLGQTLDQITAIEGQPKKVIDLKVKKIYVFSDGVKVTFKDGKSTDIQ